MGGLVQAQWSLHETSDSVYGIARGVLQAATSDNVQPLAILACEQFGNTLAISRETRLKIERIVLPTPEPATIQFLKLKVGFMKHDCAVQLGSNQAGLRFLALSAALISSVSAYRCAEALMLMLESTTSDRRLLPTTRHLVDLMSSLEGRCHFSGFADIVFGYNSIIRRTVHEILAEGSPDNYETYDIPDSEGLAALVDACRHLQRVGDHELSSVIVEAGACAAWVAAFSKWSLELPPSIYFADGTAIISQPGSLFTIIVSYPYPGEENGMVKKIKVTKRFKLDSIQDLVVECPTWSDFRYYVPLRTFGNIIQEALGNQKDAVFAALPLAITLLSAAGERGKSEIEGPEGVQQFTITQPKVFPSNNVIFKIMSRVFGLGPDFSFDSLAAVTSFRHLPDVEHFFQSPANVKYCWGRPTFTEDDEYSTLASWWANDPLDPLPRDNVFAFSTNLSFVCNYLLLISLFDNIEDLYLRAPTSGTVQSSSFHDRSCGSLYEDIVKALIRGAGFEKPHSYVNIWEDVGCSLMHSREDEWENDLVSSTQTHVFWYSILDESAPITTDPLRITSYRGRLMYERQVYERVLCDRMNMLGNTVLEGVNKPVNSATHKLYPDARAQWEIRTPLGFLYASLTLTSAGTSYGSVNPQLTIRMLTSFVIVNCEHPVDSPATEQRPEWVYWFPGKSDNIERELEIFPVAGVGELQMYCLGLISERRAELSVIRGRACFDRCIKACKMKESRFLIL
ncbi:hypothetical protein EKO27_g7756 [Xylaria grammica]|uniref:Uncharacterized protein n=1 Tax=Xylaria grammica TaxID=363999 RepID=A0A439CYP0_9PEZI|nr:hypothetical protein EKO27_g7756 [Xylaria grammica]